MSRLYRRLSEYCESDYYGFHMPGHKRNRELLGDGLPYGIDITEIEGFDDLHHAEGILRDAQCETARLYGADETRFLINGSTVGILSGILGSTKKGDRVLVARNCHKSVYHAIYLNELRPVYLYPEYQRDIHLNTELSVSAVQAALNEYSELRAVILTSPTYDGVISDIEEIAEAAHERGILLIVDEAHGAHLGFHPYFGESALDKGADVVIHSLHKTLPSLTQTALIHIKGNLANRERIFRYLDLLQSSSPSYVLMASIDQCIGFLQKEPEETFVPYAERLKLLRERFRKLERLRLLETKRYDPSKVVISTAGVEMTGWELYRILLEKYHLQLEMAAESYVIAMTSVCDTEAGFARLEQALTQIDRRLAREPVCQRKKDLAGRLPENVQEMTSAQALELAQETGRVQETALSEAAGSVSAEYAYLYPPGIPLIVPGERISGETGKLLSHYQQSGTALEGLHRQGYIRTLGRI